MKSFMLGYLLAGLILVLTGCGMMLESMVINEMNPQERCFHSCAVVHQALKNACDSIANDKDREKALEEVEIEFMNCRAKCRLKPTLHPYELHLKRQEDQEKEKWGE